MYIAVEKAILNIGRVSVMIKISKVFLGILSVLTLFCYSSDIYGTDDIAESVNSSANDNCQINDPQHDSTYSESSGDINRRGESELADSVAGSDGEINRQGNDLTESNEEVYAAENDGEINRRGNDIADSDGEINRRGNDVDDNEIPPMPTPMPSNDGEINRQGNDMESSSGVTDKSEINSALESEKKSEALEAFVFADANDSTEDQSVKEESNINNNTSKTTKATEKIENSKNSTADSHTKADVKEAAEVDDLIITATQQRDNRIQIPASLPYSSDNGLADVTNIIKAGMAFGHNNNTAQNLDSDIKYYVGIILVFVIPCGAGFFIAIKKKGAR